MHLQVGFLVQLQGRLLANVLNSESQLYGFWESLGTLLLDWQGWFRGFGLSVREFRVKGLDGLGPQGV